MYKGTMHVGLVAKNVSEAFHLYKAAARHDHLDAKRELSLMYAKGQGTNRSLDHALDLAAQLGNRGHASGNIVHRAIDAFTNGDVRESSLAYLVVAEAGVTSALHNAATLLEMLEQDANASAPILPHTALKSLAARYWHMASQVCVCVCV
jgi:hypothetical protein